MPDVHYLEITIHQLLLQQVSHSLFSFSNMNFNPVSWDGSVPTL
jgi:hypothetical protein